MARPEDPQVSEVEELDMPAVDKAALVAAPELVAQSFGEYVRAWVLRVRSGDAGALPVVGGLLIISILFQSLNSKFLTAGNLVNLLIQGAVYMLLAMSEVFVLLLGEIDLSAGFVAGLGGVVMAELIKESTGWPIGAAIVVALLFTAAIGALHGTLITRIGLPSFVVTLAGLLGWQGVMLLILGQGGVVPINSKIVNDLTSGQLTVVASWIVMAALVAAYGARAWLRDSRRRASGLVAPPPSVTVLRIAAGLAAGVVVVLVCNTNRGVLTSIRGRRHRGDEFVRRPGQGVPGRPWRPGDRRHRQRDGTPGLQRLRPIHRDGAGAPGRRHHRRPDPKGPDGSLNLGLRSNDGGHR